jgi:hypothetical protein
MELIVNRGTGAGGANTNKNGKSFEDKTDNLPHLIENDFIRHEIPKEGKKPGKFDYYYEKETHVGTITFIRQGGLESYFRWKFNIDMFRHPDEAYIIKRGDKIVLKVLEKKNQNVDGSVDTKLLAGSGFIREYKKSIGRPDFSVEYAFCLSNFLKEKYLSADKKWNILREINEEDSIPVFFGDDADYSTKLNAWIYS